MDAEADNEASSEFYMKPGPQFNFTLEHGISCARLLLYKANSEGIENLIYDLKGRIRQISCEQIFSPSHDIKPPDSLISPVSRVMLAKTQVESINLGFIQGK